VAFQASQLYSLSCPDSGPVWVEFENSDAGSKAAGAIRQRVHTLGTVSGVFTGVFQHPGRYGHLGDYPYQCNVTKTEQLRTIDRKGLPPPGEKRIGTSAADVCVREDARPCWGAVTFSHVTSAALYANTAVVVSSWSSEAGTPQGRMQTVQVVGTGTNFSDFPTNQELLEGVV